MPHKCKTAVHWLMLAEHLLDITGSSMIQKTNTAAPSAQRTLVVDVNVEMEQICYINIQQQIKNDCRVSKVTAHPGAAGSWHIT